MGAVVVDGKKGLSLSRCPPDPVMTLQTHLTRAIFLKFSARYGLSAVIAPSCSSLSASKGNCLGQLLSTERIPQVPGSEASPCFHQTALSE